MGWTGLYRTEKDTKKFFQKEFGDNYEVLACSAKLRTVYMAVKNKKDDSVFGVVCLTRWDGRAYDSCNFYYKDMDESMEPCAYDCPEKILKLLTYTENRFALNWRGKCWKRIYAKALHPRPKLKVGMKLVSKTPIIFRNGESLSEFFVVSTKPLRFYPTPNFGYTNWVRYKLPKRIIDTLEILTP